MYDAIAVEELGKPTVSICNYGFIEDAKSAASGIGMPGIRTVSESIPSECSVTRQIEDGIDAVIDDIINGLVKPLTEEEKTPASREPKKKSKIVFKGNLEEINRFFCSPANY